MFSRGQFIFAIFSIILFIVVIGLSYRKDKALHRKYYKGVLKVLAGFLLFMAILFLIKYILQK